MIPCNVFYRIKPHYGSALPHLARMNLESIPALRCCAQQGFSSQPEVQALATKLGNDEGTIIIESIIPVRSNQD